MLDEDEYTRRKEFYMERGQRHYYFMNIGNGEYIDALRKVPPVVLHAVALELCRKWGGLAGKRCLSRGDSCGC